MPATQRTTKEGRGSRRRILDVTIELVCERGFAGTSVNAVCERVGVAKTALYWFFGSKAGLMAAVIDEVTVSWLDEIRSDVYFQGTPDERLDKLVGGLRDIVENRPELLRIMLVGVMERGNVEPGIRETVRRLTDDSIEMIGNGFEATLGVKLPDIDLLAHTIIALMEAALRRKLMDPECDLDRLFDDMRRTIDVLVRDRMRRLTTEK